MRLNTDRSQSEFQFSWKHGLAILLVVAAVVAGWSVARKIMRTSRGLPPTETEIQAQNQPRRPSREEMRAEMSKVYDEIGVTAEQRERIDNLPQPEGREGWRERREAMEKILTPEQHEKMRAAMRARWQKRREEMLKNLSPEDRAEMERRFEQWRSRRERDGGRRRAPDGENRPAPEGGQER